MEKPLKIAAISYPILFQTIGGLQIQVWETVDAVRRAGHDMRLIDPVRERFTDFDVVHVFSVIHGNHKIVRQAKDWAKPVIMSALLRPIWTRSLGRRAELADRIVGRLTNWVVSTEYRQMRSGLHLADRCVALGTVERRSMIEAFGITASQINVVPNGIPARFFQATPDLALNHFKLERGFVLCVASIEPHKNQLGLARALQGTGYELVMVGQCMTAHQGYLAEVLALPGTRHLGSLNYDDPLLPSLYAAAGALCLVSQSEVMPLVVLEALAAGTPAVMTQNHCMDVSDMASCLREVDPNDAASVRGTLGNILARPPTADSCRASVAHLTWDAVAKQLVSIYRDVVTAQAATAPA